MKNTGNQLVIEGKITNGNGPYSVKIARTSSKQRIMEPLGGAHIIIFDDTDHNQGLFTEKNTGTYELDGNIFKGQPGHTYHIKVTLQNGSIYQSRPETMPITEARDSAYYKIANQTVINQYGIPVHNHVVKVYSDTYLPKTSKPYYLKWYVSEVYILQEFYVPNPISEVINYCYITGYPDPQNISLLDGSGAGKSEIKNQLVASQLVDYTFYYKHVFNVHVESMTHSAYVYWKHVDEIINASGTIFDVPPATAIGNIYNPNDSKEDVLGYFEAVTEDTARCSLYRNYFNFNISSPCPEPDSHLGCNSCLDNPNGSTKAPYYLN